MISRVDRNLYRIPYEDILYIEKEDSLVRRSVQTVLYNILKDLVVLLAPILPYTSEEVYRFIPGEKLESVHLNDMPEAPTYEFDSKLWELFFDVKDDVFKALEEARNEKVIGSSLEAEVKLNLGEKYKPVREQLEKYLHQLLIVSKVEFTDDETLPKASTIRVEVLKSNGQKCNRCWNYVDELDGDICHRCSEILKETK